MLLLIFFKANEHMNNYQIKNIQHGSENKDVMVIKQLNALADELV